ncbi:division plane positioning ATPase MipZ [uncultured Umboniibacter sp.]|uniref:division plane positioning ATPase MipZ n=1 Tax=uncultured Umboniibacter sp. TaxID=1798917 RepID=UPI00261AB941|nr:division plane positioning ATPase MipZ [uncultured Umboniibacter sp.]
MGKVCTFGINKGGTGKSTLSFNFAIACASRGFDVLLIDADPQSSAAKWIAYREAELHDPTVHCIQKTGNIVQTVRDLKQRYELVVIDTGGRDSKELRTAALCSDVLVSPIQPSQSDLDAAIYHNEMIAEVKTINEKLDCYAILSVCSPHRLSVLHKESKEFVKECLSEFSLLHSRTINRDAYRRSISSGQSVIEGRDPSAKAEIEALTDELLDRLELARQPNFLKRGLAYA